MVLARADYTRLLTFRFPCVYIPETDALHSADISTITAESTRTLINSGPNSKMLIHLLMIYSSGGNCVNQPRVVSR